MTIVEIDDSQLTVHIQGWHRFWALKNSITVRLENVTAVRADPDPDAIKSLHGLKAPGARVPGMIAAGTFRSIGSKEFWDIGRNHSKILVIELRNDQYGRLVVDVEDPVLVAGQIETAISGRLQPNA